MRVLAVVMFGLLTAVMQSTALAQTQPLPPGVSPEEAHAGCLHTQLRACMISLGTVFWFDMTSVAARIARRNEPDVNGNTAHRRLAFDARLPLETAYIAIALTLGSPAPNDEVVKIELSLPLDPEDAHTASDYDRTNLNTAVSVLLGSKCPGFDKLAFYRFFENTIKPSEHIKTDTRKYGIFHYSTQTVDTAKAPFCGALFSLHRRSEFNGPPDAPNRESVKKSDWFIAIE